MTTLKTTLILTAALATLSMVACEKSETTNSAETQAPDASLAKYFTDEEMPGAEDIHTARTTAKPGEEITLRGEIMGRGSVFVEGRAAFVLGDPTKLTTCDKMPDDQCSTPWDACCDAKELRKDSVASIQILGEDNRVLQGTLKGVNGLKEISLITVTGTVDESSTPENLIVNATKIHIVRE